ncbi:MAG: hypothetical protein LBC92_00255, partial [Rickettsiales bacterium]|nr:hypothetical protein [Rickettsiales bacterium]
FWPKYDLDKALPRYGLERINEYVKVAKIPLEKIPPIFHITGTNGKGSVTAFLKYILEANNYLVHRFTSPHIVDWNERIEISSKIITDDYANQCANECKNIVDENNLQLSYFEGMFAIALNAFLKEPATATIIEVGMGGRYDATNVIDRSLASIITYISLDHCKTLGETEELIAIEKAEIIKQNGITIVAKQKKQSVIDIIVKTAKERNNKIYIYGVDFFSEKIDGGFVFNGFGKTLKLPLPNLIGEHQIDNATAAIAALLSQSRIKISDDSVAKGLKNAHWLGRLQNLSNSKLSKYLPKDAVFFIDGAHNDSGAKILKEWLELEKAKTKSICERRNILITSMLSRKNSGLFIENLDKCFDLVLTVCMSNEEKSKSPSDFKQEFIDNGWNNVVAIDGDFIEALNYVKENLKGAVRVVISGSLHLVGEVLEIERKMGGNIYQ